MSLPNWTGSSVARSFCRASLGTSRRTVVIRRLDLANGAEGDHHHSRAEDALLHVHPSLAAVELGDLANVLPIDIVDRHAGDHLLPQFLVVLPEGHHRLAAVAAAHFLSDRGIGPAGSPVLPLFEYRLRRRQRDVVFDDRGLGLRQENVAGVDTRDEVKGNVEGLRLQSAAEDLHIPGRCIELCNLADLVVSGIVDWLAFCMYLPMSSTTTWRLLMLDILVSFSLAKSSMRVRHREPVCQYDLVIPSRGSRRKKDASLRRRPWADPGQTPCLQHPHHRAMKE